MIFSSLLPSQKQYNIASTAGITPAAPLVGAVTTLPKEAFSSFTANAKQLTQSRIYLKSLPPERMAASHES